MYKGLFQDLRLGGGGTNTDLGNGALFGEKQRIGSSSESADPPMMKIDRKIWRNEVLVSLEGVISCFM